MLYNSKRHKFNPKMVTHLFANNFLEKSWLKVCNTMYIGTGDDISVLGVDTGQSYGLSSLHRQPSKKAGWLGFGPRKAHKVFHTWSWSGFDKILGSDLKEHPLGW